MVLKYFPIWEKIILIYVNVQANERIRGTHLLISPSEGRIEILSPFGSKIRPFLFGPWHCLTLLPTFIGNNFVESDSILAYKQTNSNPKLPAHSMKYINCSVGIYSTWVTKNCNMDTATVLWKSAKDDNPLTAGVRDGQATGHVSIQRRWSHIRNSLPDSVACGCSM